MTTITHYFPPPSVSRLGKFGRGRCSAGNLPPSPWATEVNVSAREREGGWKENRRTVREKVVTQSRSLSKLSKWMAGCLFTLNSCTPITANMNCRR